jgi:V-type H+-transporting ATPase subunit F
MPQAKFKIKGMLLVGIIADETTVTGFLLTGMGERSKEGKSNFYIVDKDVSDADIEKNLRELLARTDIGVIFVSQTVAERVRHVISDHEEIIPTILEIPSKEAPYDPEKDAIVVKAAAILWGSDTGKERLQQLAKGGQ